jgi:DNA-binding transcriptional LysR family regulator
LEQTQKLFRLYNNLGSASAGSPAAKVTIGAIASVQRSFLPDALAALYQRLLDCRTRVLLGLEERERG